MGVEDFSGPWWKWFCLKRPLVEKRPAQDGDSLIGHIGQESETIWNQFLDDWLTRMEGRSFEAEPWEPHGFCRNIRFHPSTGCMPSFQRSFRQDDGLLQKFGAEFVKHNAFRAVIVVEVHRVQSSCGFSIPFYDYLGERNVLKDYFAERTAQQAMGWDPDLHLDLTVISRSIKRCHLSPFPSPFPWWIRDDPCIQAVPQSPCESC